MAPKTIGERMAWARERAGLNKNRFARELGTSWQHVDHWEKGRTDPSLASLKRIAEVLGVSVDFLLGVRSDPAASSNLERFLAELAPPDLSEEEEQWLRRAPLDPHRAMPDDYRRLLEGLRRIGSMPSKSGRRRKVDSVVLDGEIRTRKGRTA